MAARSHEGTPREPAGELKVGAKVTVMYTMTATSIEAKGGDAKAPDAKAAPAKK